METKVSAAEVAVRAAAETAGEVLESVGQATNTLWMALAMALVRSGNLTKAEIVEAINSSTARFELQGDALQMVEQIRDAFNITVAEVSKN